MKKKPIQCDTPQQIDYQELVDKGLEERDWSRALSDHHKHLGFFFSGVRGDVRAVYMKEKHGYVHNSVKSLWLVDEDLFGKSESRKRSL